ncbi:Hypothetical protein R9X50_00512800 [Acrodontium crateriforme]|uniref:Uncharacterized protein n=1 Tax=Acrodontium crateriforme TaxID=150365 RepID=A0AAQ3M7B3_9PEZI|nr:Hypothetical protein R9X50_00512800 [Acrodontium crateriforme]
MSAPASLLYSSKLAGKKVLVFECTSGIGLSVATIALAESTHVYISSSNQTKLDAAAKNLETNLHAILTTATKNGPLDHVVFTAGNALTPAHVTAPTATSIHTASIVRFVAPAIAYKLLASKQSFFTPSPVSSITFTSGKNSAN